MEFELSTSEENYSQNDLNINSIEDAPNENLIISLDTDIESEINETQDLENSKGVNEFSQSKKEEQIVEKSKEMTVEDTTEEIIEEKIIENSTEKIIEEQIEEKIEEKIEEQIVENSTETIIEKSTEVTIEEKIVELIIKNSTEKTEEEEIYLENSTKETIIEKSTEMTVENSTEEIIEEQIEKQIEEQIIENSTEMIVEKTTEKVEEKTIENSTGETLLEKSTEIIVEEKIEEQITKNSTEKIIEEEYQLEKSTIGETIPEEQSLDQQTINASHFNQITIVQNKDNLSQVNNIQDTDIILEDQKNLEQNVNNLEENNISKENTIIQSVLENELTYENNDFNHDNWNQVMNGTLTVENKFKKSKKLSQEDLEKLENKDNLFCINCGVNLITRKRDGSTDSSKSDLIKTPNKKEEKLGKIKISRKSSLDEKGGSQTISKSYDSKSNIRQEKNHTKFKSDSDGILQVSSDILSEGYVKLEKNNSSVGKDLDSASDKVRDRNESINNLSDSTNKQKSRIKSSKNIDFSENSDENANDSSNIFTNATDITNDNFESTQKNINKSEKITSPICEDCIDECLINIQSKKNRLIAMLNQFDFILDSFSDSNSFLGFIDSNSVDSDLNRQDQQQDQQDNDSDYEDLNSITNEIQELQHKKNKLKDDIELLGKQENIQERKNTIIHSCEVEAKILELTEDYNSSIRQREYLFSQLTKLVPTHILNETFSIGCYELIGTINGFRLGRTPILHVEWLEVNAALGQVALLLYSVSRYQQYRFDKISILPKGAYSKITKGSTTYDLYGGSGFSGFFWKKKFDQALCILLEATDYLCIEAEKELKENRPYKIINDVIGEFSIKYSEKNEEKWTHALKSLLVNLKFLLLWVAQVG